MKVRSIAPAAKELRVLIVEDTPEDAELLVRELERGGYVVDSRRVETERDMREALVSEGWDIVLSDYALPGFSAISALSVLQTSGLDLPFIIVSGTIGEETAVEALKAGAHDFLVKGRLARLHPAIERERREASRRRQARAAEGELRESERKYRQIVETTQEGICAADAFGLITHVNRRMAEMLVAPVEELLERPMFEILADDQKRAEIPDLERLRSGVPLRYELKLARCDGSEFWASISANAVIDDDGTFAGALAMVTDITEQRKLQAQLMMSDRLASVGMLAAGVAHEINNPLAALIANLELAVRDLVELAPEVSSKPVYDDIVGGLQDARYSAERVRQIVRDMKLFSQAESDKTSRVDVQRVLESTLRMAWNEVRHRARLIREYQVVPEVEANESRLGQVFLNLLVNAAQSIEEGHAQTNEIRIATRVEGQQVVVEVRDTGSGMTSEVMKRLFVPFFTTKLAGLGTGLGLSICHRIVTSFGGAIEVESEVDKGSVFRVMLPAAPAQSALASEPPVSVPGRAARRAQVLVIDDEVMILNAASRTLSREHEVTTTVSGEEALRYIREGKRFDVIICDLMMPQMTGMEFFEELSREAPDQAACVVFLTGGAFTPRARAFLDEVSNHRIDKPFEPNALRAIINERTRD